MVKLHSPLDQVDSSALYTVGSRTVDKNGSEYIYLPGQTSVAKYDWVIYKTAGAGLSYGSVTRLLKAYAGNVAIAQAAVVGPKYGWFQIYGIGWGNVGDTFSAGSPIYSCGTTATVSTTYVASCAIYNAIGLQTGASGGTGMVLLNYPMVFGQVI
jgi:hypothetical protein